MKEKTFSIFLKFFIGLEMIFIIACTVISQSAISDDLEHMHASWLVWNGQVPYTDFFEHHHPLMWYLFAPIMGMANRNIMVFFLIRGIMCMVSFSTLYVVYRIVKDFIADKITGLLAICTYCSLFSVQCALVLFKPDLFMHLFFLLGVYYFFKFIRDAKQKDLNISAIMFTIGFLFLQTIIFLILPVGAVGIYLLIKKKISVKSLLLAAVIPAIILISSIAFLYFSGNLERYWQLNWVVNSQIASNVYVRVIDFSHLYIYLISGIICAGFLIYKRPSIYITTIVLMFFSELLWRTLYMSVHEYYFKMLLLYNMLLISIVVVYIWKKYNPVAYAVIIWLAAINLSFFFLEHLLISKTTEALTYTTIMTNNTKSSDVVLGSSHFTFGVFNKNPHYYWFLWHYVGHIDAQLYHYAPEFDINQILIKQRPRFVYFENYLHPGYTEGEKYDIDMKLLLKYYEPTNHNLLFVRKMKV